MLCELNPLYSKSSIKYKKKFPYESEFPIFFLED